MKQKTISELLNSKEIYIIFGGPSLKGFDLSKLDNKPTLACNKCAEVYKANAVISIDPTYINTRSKFLKNYDGYVALGHRETKPSISLINDIGPDYLFWHDKKHPEKMSDDPEVIYGTNTGHAAINFAALQGFKKIHALGLDMGRRSHWHSGYSNSGIADMGYWAKYLDGCKDWLDGRGVELINYNPDSNVRAFKFGDLNDLS